ncbi:putative reverse transcriptase domain-containing protein [Tanacetum coccineum]
MCCEGMTRELVKYSVGISECLRRERKTARPQLPMAASTEALIAEYAFAPTPPSPPPSPLSPLSSPLLRISSPPLLLPPLHTIPTYAHAPLGYKAPWFKVGESSAAVDARQTGLDFTYGTDYGIIDTLNAKDRSMTLEALIKAHEARITALEAQITTLQSQHGRIEWQRQEAVSPKKTTTPMSNAAIKVLVALSMDDALAEHECTKCGGISTLQTVGHDAALWNVRQTLMKMIARQGHCKKDCLKLKNKNCENQAENGEARARAYAVGNAGINLDSNVVTGTFLLNNRYASILFDTGTDRSFVSAAFSSLIDIIPSILDHDYDETHH